MSFDTYKRLRLFYYQDDNKDYLVSYGDKNVLPRLIALAANADNSEIQYNCAGTVGQLTLTGTTFCVMTRISINTIATTGTLQIKLYCMLWFFQIYLLIYCPAACGAC